MKFEAYAIDEAAQAGVSSLERWLLHDSDVAGKCDLQRSSASAAGEMGGSLDAVIAITGQVMTLGNLLIAYATWRGTRPPLQSKIMVTVEFDESTQEISSMSDIEIQNLVAELTQRKGTQ